MMNKNVFSVKKVYEMATDGVLESRGPVTAGEAEAKRKKIEGQTHAVNRLMPQLTAEPGTERRSVSRSRSNLSLAVRLVSTLFVLFCHCGGSIIHWRAHFHPKFVGLTAKIPSSLPLPHVLAFFLPS